jgi:hypothetical protein
MVKSGISETALDKEFEEICVDLTAKMATVNNQYEKGVIGYQEFIMKMHDVITHAHFQSFIKLQRLASKS